MSDNTTRDPIAVHRSAAASGNAQTPPARSLGLTAADAEHLEMWAVITDRVWSAMHAPTPQPGPVAQPDPSWTPRLVLVGRREGAVQT